MRQNDEFGVSVSNPDGAAPKNPNDGKQTYRNDTRRAVPENPSRSVKEISSYDERLTCVARKPVESGATEQTSGGKSSDAATGSLVSRGVRTVTNGLGGVGALLGVVGASVGAAAVVVAYVLLAFSVSVSLFASTCHSLTFFLEIENEENKPLVAILSREDFSDERDLAGVTYLTFDDLHEGWEYVLTVKNRETDEVYFRQSFVTPEEIDERAGIFNASLSEDTLWFWVSAEGLPSDGFYTVTVSDGEQTLFVADETEREREFTVKVPEKVEEVVVSVRIDRAVVAFERVERYHEPEVTPSYDYANASWDWADDYTVTVTVRDANGVGEDLVFTPEVLYDVTEATCEESGSVLYYAVIEDENGQGYSDERLLTVEPAGHSYGAFIPEVAATCEEDGKSGHYVCAACGKYFDVEKTELQEEELVLPALGHDYGAPAFEWTETENGYEATAVFTCSRDESHVNHVAATVTSERTESSCTADGKIVYTASVTFPQQEYHDTLNLPITAMGHDYGDWIGTVAASCEEDGAAGHYECSVCHKVFNADHEEVTAESLVLPATGHEYGEWVGTVAASCEEDGAAAHYECSACHKVFNGDKEEVTAESLVLPATGHDYGDWVEGTAASCEEDGTAGHFECSVCHKVFDANQDEITTGLVLPATGHTYGEWIDEVSAGCETEGTAGHYECSVCHDLFDENYEKVTESSLILTPTGHDYEAPEWTWTEDGGDGYTATATFTCSQCGHEEEESASVTLTDSTAADCSTETNGSQTYTATVTFNEQEYEDERMDTIPYEHTIPAQAEYTFPQELTGIEYATGTLSDVVYATYTCSTCSHEVSVPCETTLTVTSDGPMFTLSAGDQQQEYLLSFTDAELEYSYDEENDCFLMCGLASSDQPGAEPVTNVTIPTTFYGKPVTGIASYAFSGSDVDTLTVGSHITSIKEYAFSGAFNLTTVSLPGVDVPAYAFDGDSALAGVTIASGATEIGAHAFDGCSSLTTLTIPDTVTQIGEGAFARMSALETLTVPFVGSAATNATASEETLLGYWFIGGDGNTGSVTEVSQGYSMETASEYYLPESLTSITITGGKVLFGALMNCASLATITLGSGVDTIDAFAFLGCNESASVAIACEEGYVWNVYDSEETLVETYTAADLTNGSTNLQLLFNGVEYGYVWRKTTA